MWTIGDLFYVFLLELEIPRLLLFGRTDIAVSRWFGKGAVYLLVTCTDRLLKHKAAVE